MHIKCKSLYALRINNAIIQYKIGIHFMNSLYLKLYAKLITSIGLWLR